MMLKIFALFCVLQYVSCSLIQLPSADVEKFFDKLATEKPSLMKAANDASLVGMSNIEGGLHRKIEDAKNLVDLAQSLNLTILVKALEETGMDNIIDHEGIIT